MARKQQQCSTLQVIYHGVPELSKGLPHWTVFCESNHSMQRTATAPWDDTMQDARVWYQNREIVAVQIRRRGRSDQWSSEILGLYGEQGELLYSRALINTSQYLCWQQGGPDPKRSQLQVVEEAYYESSGMEIARNTTVPLYPQLQLDRLHYSPSPCRLAVKASDLSFYSVIAKLFQ